MDDRDFSPAVSGILVEEAARKKEPAAYSPQVKPSWREACVCALSYMLATLFVFTPLRRVLGNNKSKHIVPMISIWFHPVRTRGNLVEVIYYTALLMGMCLTDCAVTAMTLHVGPWMGIPPQLTSFVVLGMLCTTFGLMGMLKISTSDPSYQTASSAAILFLVAIMVGDPSVQRGILTADSVVQHVKIILIGAGISTVVCFVVYRKTSIEALRKKSSLLSLLVARMLECLADNLAEDSGNEEWLEHYGELTLGTQKLLLEMRDHAKYAPYGLRISKFLAKCRPGGAKIARAVSTDYYRVMEKVASVRRQAMHLGGMRHSVYLINKHLYRTAKQHQWLPAQEALIKELSSSVREFSRTLVDYVYESGGEYYYEEAESHSRQWAAVQLVASRLRLFTSRRDPVLHKLVDLGGDDTLHATCVLFSHVLQKLSEEILFGFSGHSEVNAMPDPASEVPESWMPSRNTDRHAAETLERLNSALDTSAAPSGWFPRRLRRLARQQDVRYGLRVGLGAFCLCLPAFLNSTHEWFHNWHGEWAVNIYMIVMVRNMGGMRSNFRLRLIGSTLGALVGMVVSELWEKHVVMLALCSFVMSVFCFRRLLSDHYPVFGRFILMSYNLVCLYCYTMELEHPAVKPPITFITFHRIIAVAFGVIWSVVTTTFVLPHSASRTLRYNLCIQWMRMGMGWKADPLSIQTVNDREYFRGFPIERELQVTMLGLNTLLQGCCDEIRINSDFRREPYAQLLQSTKIILDSIHSFCTLLEDESALSESEEGLALNTEQQRHRLCQFLFLQFYISATSIRLGFPLPDYFSSSKEFIKAYSDSVDQQWELRKNTAGSQEDLLSFYDFVLFHSFVTVAYTAFHEVRKIHKSLHEIYGPYQGYALFD